jgi:hypothetical protein
MAHNFGSPVNFNQQEAQNIKLHNLGSAPGTPVAGQIWLNTGDGYLYYRDNSGVNRQLVHFSALLATRLDQFAAPNTSLSMNSQKITNLLDPTSLQDAATKSYVDALVAGLKWKDPVRVATTAAITLSGTQTIDGVAVIAGDRVAVINQLTTAFNGIYVVSAGGWSRSADADTGAEIFGACFFVSEGTTLGNRQYVCTTDAPITINSTALLFAQIGGSVSYTPGTGISFSSNTILLDTSVAARKVEGLLGNGAATSFTVTHNLNSTAIVASLWKVSTGEFWQPDISYTGGSSATQCTFNFGFAPTTNEYRFVIHG